MLERDTVNYADYSTIRNLVMLPCHAIYKGKGTGENFDDWNLEEFQKEGNDNLAWIKQIQQCVNLIDNETIVIISGGKTKRYGNISESFSYLNLILQNWDKFICSGDAKDEYEVKKEQMANLIFLEEYAKDSFENLLYSICRFKEITKKFPQKVTIVGYKFKETRFVKNHSEALNLSKRNIGLEYIGIDPEPTIYAKDSPEYRKFFTDLDKFEYNRAVLLFATDPLGIKEPLIGKKRTRNPYNTVAPYAVSNKSFLKEVVDHNSEHYKTKGSFDVAYKNLRSQFSG